MNENASNMTNTPLSPGQTLGKYNIVEQIGAGGMSIVWKGHDPLLNQFVAIKQMKLDVASDQMESFYAQFRQEAEVQKRLSQDQKFLVRIIEFIEDQRGLFIVMEYVEGKSLEQILATERGPMPARKALGIVATTAKALEVLHSREVIHRDLKPSNIMLTKDGGLKLCDFGVATLIADQEAMSLGSVRYMAPELFQDQAADPRADLYSLGMIAYEMLAGRDNFDEAFKLVLRDQRNQSLRWMKWHTNARVNATPLTRLVDDMPQALSDLVDRMMQKDPAVRIASTDALVKAIRAHFTSTGIEKDIAPTPTASSAAAAVDDSAPTAEIPKPKVLPKVIAAVVVLLVLGAGGYFGYDRYQKNQAAQLRFDNAKKAFFEAKELQQNEEHAKALAGFDALYADWSEHPQMGKPIKARSLFSKAILARDAGEYDQAVDLLNKADEYNILDRQRIRDLIRDTQTRASFADLKSEVLQLVDAGQYDDARTRLRQWQQDTTAAPEEKAILDDLWHQLKTSETNQVVDKTLTKAANLEAADQRAQAIDLLIRTNEQYPHPRLQERIDHYNVKTQYEKLLNAAESAEVAGDLETAIDDLNQANQLLPSESLADQIDNLRAEQLFAQGKAAEAKGDVQVASDAYERALTFASKQSVLDKITQAISRLETRNARQALVDEGNAAMRSGAFERAVQQYTEAEKLAHDEEVARKLRDAKIQMHLQTGSIQLNQDNPAGARQAYNQVLELDEENEDANQGLKKVAQWEEYKTHLDQGDKHRDAARYSKAIREYHAAKKILQTETVIQRIEDANAASALSQARRYMDARDYQTARSLLNTLTGKYRTQEVIDMLEEIDKRLRNE